MSEKIGKDIYGHYGYTIDSRGGQGLIEGMRNSLLGKNSKSTRSVRKILLGLALVALLITAVAGAMIMYWQSQEVTHDIHIEGMDALLLAPDYDSYVAKTDATILASTATNVVIEDCVTFVVLDDNLDGDLAIKVTGTNIPTELTVTIDARLSSYWTNAEGETGGNWVNPIEYIATDVPLGQEFVVANADIPYITWRTPTGGYTLRTDCNALILKFKFTANNGLWGDFYGLTFVVEAGEVSA